jgi:hypothetical protein
MSHLRKESGCHTPEAKRVKLSESPEDTNKSEGINSIEDGFKMINLDEALMPLGDVETSGDVETGWEFIQQQVMQQQFMQQQFMQQQVVQEEIIPEQAANIVPAGYASSGPLFAPRPVFVPYELVSPFQISHIHANISSQQPPCCSQVRSRRGLGAQVDCEPALRVRCSRCQQ